MSDTFTSVEHQGFLSRVFKSIVGVFIGILMIPGSIFLLSWNEYRTIHRSIGLAEGEKLVQEVANPENVDAKTESKLVHLTAKATTDETLSDPVFPIQRNAIHLARRVEMYQWVERSESRTRNKLGGGTETVTEYTYEKRWEGGRVSSESFEHKSGHENPDLKYPSLTVSAQKVMAGAYVLNSELIEDINDWRDVPISYDELMQKVPEEQRANFVVDSNSLYVGTKAPVPSSPELGDVRIRFQVVEPTNVSILAAQSGPQLGRFKTSNGETILSLMVGTYSAHDMFESLKSQNTMIAWILRLLGWIVAGIGFNLISRPLSVIASVVPFLGRMTGGVSFLLSMFLGAVVAIITIAIAWIAVRPAFGIGLLILAAAGLFFVFRGKKRTEAPPILQPLN